MSYPSSVTEQVVRILEIEIQELRKEIVSLKQKNETSQQQNDELKSENKTLTSIIEELPDRQCEKLKLLPHMEQVKGHKTPENVSYITVLVKLFIFC